MAVSKWILVAIVLNRIGNSSGALARNDFPTYFLENCSLTEIKLHKDKPNDVVRIRLFKDFPEKPHEKCESVILAWIDEFHKAWYKGTLSRRLSNYKVMVTLEEIEWPPSKCDRIFCVVEDMKRNASTVCNELEENLFSYRFDLTYRRFLPLEKDYDLDMTVAVAYKPYGLETDGCPSNDFFQCATDSLCIPSRFWCDGVRHCEDESDEKDCNVSKRPPTVIAASPEEPEPVHLSEEATSSSEDYSSEDSTEPVTPIPDLSTTSTIRITTKSEPPTTTRQEPKTTRRPVETTTNVPLERITKASTKKAATPVTKPSTVQQKPTMTVKTTSKPTTTSIATTPMAPATVPSPPPLAVDAPPKSPPVTSSTQAPSSSTKSSLITTSTPTTDLRNKVSTPGPTQTFVHFSFTDRPSIIVIPGASVSELSTSIPTTTSQSRQAETHSTLEIPDTTTATVDAGTTSNERRRERYKIEAVPLDPQNEIELTTSTATMKSRTSSSSSEHNKSHYPWSDQYGSRSRNSSATCNNGAPKQWVLVLLCLVLVFIYFFL